MPAHGSNRRKSVDHLGSDHRDITGPERQNHIPRTAPGDRLADWLLGTVSLLPAKSAGKLTEGEAT